jgi:hypothetical protein
MALSSPPESLILSIVGLLTGAACRSDMLPFKAYRLPNWVNKIGSVLRPLIGSTDPGFRSVSALPENGLGAGSSATGSQEAANAGPTPTDLTSGVTDTANAPRNPTQQEIAQLSAMFPSASRAQILNAIGST